MVRILLPIAAALAACTPSPQDTAMPNASPGAGATGQGSSGAAPAGEGPAAPGATAHGDPERAAVEPAAQPISAAANPLPAGRTDSPAEAEGRRTLSTAFVRVGPDNILIVETRNKRTLVLRDVVLRPTDYCGTLIAGGKAGGRYCGGYAEVAAARPGEVPAPE